MGDAGSESAPSALGQTPQSPLFPVLLEGLVGSEQSLVRSQRKVDAPAASFTATTGASHSSRKPKAAGPAAHSAEHSFEDAGSLAMPLSPLAIVQPETPLPAAQTAWGPWPPNHEKPEEAAADPLGARSSVAPDWTPVATPAPPAFFPTVRADPQSVAAGQSTCPAPLLPVRPAAVSGAPVTEIWQPARDFTARPATPPSGNSYPEPAESFPKATWSSTVASAPEDTAPDIEQPAPNPATAEFPGPASEKMATTRDTAFCNPRQEQSDGPARLKPKAAPLTQRPQSSYLEPTAHASDNSPTSPAPLQAGSVPPVLRVQDLALGSASPLLPQKSMSPQRAANSRSSLDSPAPAPSLTPVPPEVPPHATRNDSRALSYAESEVVERPRLEPVGMSIDESGRLFQADTPSPQRAVDARNPVGQGSSETAHELAFQGYLVPLPASQKTAVPASTPVALRETSPLKSGLPERSAASPASQNTGTTDVSPVRGATHSAATAQDEASGKDRGNDSTWKPRKSEHATASRVDIPDNPDERFVETAVQAPPQSTSRPAAAPRATPPEARPEPPQNQPQPAGTQSAPRDIKLELSSGGQRVEVRVADRGGDVHVAVRTSDTHLAGALREDLPALSSRLEQTGLRADTWHTTPSVDQLRRDLDSPAGSNPQDSNSQHHPDSREQQDQPERQRPRIYEDQPDRKEKGKQFEWLMSSLR